MTDCPDCGRRRSLRVHDCQDTGNCIAYLKSQLSAALARAEAAELENRAWRALAVFRNTVWQRWQPPYQSDDGGAWVTFASFDPAKKLPVVFADGPTAQAAAVTLATKLNLLDPESGAKGEGGGKQ